MYFILNIIYINGFNNNHFLPFRQLGQYEDEKLGGLYYNRFRYYDSNSGTYISKDPIGLAGNNPNLYAYTHDSNSWVDPFGLNKCGGKFKEINKQALPDWIVESFEGGNYKTVMTQEDIIVYRVFGGKASSTGAFVTTVPACNLINAKIDAALLPEWKNFKEFETIIKIPKGTILNIGKVAPQTTISGTILEGGADQYLMP